MHQSQYHVDVYRTLTCALPHTPQQHTCSVCHLPFTVLHSRVHSLIHHSNPLLHVPSFYALPATHRPSGSFSFLTHTLPCSHVHSLTHYCSPPLALALLFTPCMKNMLSWHIALRAPAPLLCQHIFSLTHYCRPLSDASLPASSATQQQGSYRQGRYMQWHWWKQHHSYSSESGEGEEQRASVQLHCEYQPPSAAWFYTAVQHAAGRFVS